MEIIMAKDKQKYTIEELEVMIFERLHDCSDDVIVKIAEIAMDIKIIKVEEDQYNIEWE